MLSYQTPTNSISTDELIQKLSQREQEQRAEQSIPKCRFELPAELVTLIASSHVYVKGKLDLLEVFFWQKPDLEKD